MEQALLREPDVRAMLGVSRATLWRWRKDGGFPSPRKIGPNSIAWRREDVAAWLESCPTVSGEAA